MTSPGRIPTEAHDDDEEWMAFFHSLTDPDLDALLAGEQHALADLQQIDDLVATLRAAAVRHGAPPMSAALYAQIQREQPVVPRGRRRLVAVAAGCLLFGGTAVGIAGAQDVLPDPLQDATATVATAFGVDLPRSTDHAPVQSPSGDPDEGVADGDGATDTDGVATDPAVTEPAVSDPAVSGEPSDAPGAEGGTSTGGPPATTPSGATPATPADPGTPGDQEPATPATPAIPPATPPAVNGQAQSEGQGKGEGSANGQGQAHASGSAASARASSIAAASR